MFRAIVDTLPLGLGIALNPVAIVISILLLRESSSRRRSLAFIVGWMFGLALLETLSTVIVQVEVEARRLVPETLLAILWIGLGLLLLLLGAIALRRQSSLGEPADPQRWLRLVKTRGNHVVFGLGLFMSMASLRNVALLAAAGVVFGQAGLGGLERVATISAFVLVSSVGILIPFAVLAVGGANAETILDRWASWLGRHMLTMTGVISALLGLYLLGKGVAIIS